jgi:hypothetical protein
MNIPIIYFVLWLLMAFWIGAEIGYELGKRQAVKWYKETLDMTKRLQEAREKKVRR